MQLQCDVHTHTIYSRHAYATILENVTAAKEAGLSPLGSTDHFSSILIMKIFATISISVSVILGQRKSMAYDFCRAVRWILWTSQEIFSAMTFPLQRI